MANNVWGANGKDERKSSRNMIYENLVPSSCWTEDTDCHVLLIDLPGFKKEEVRIQADNNHGHVIVRGERQSNNYKIIHFEQSFKVPTDCNIEETSGKFEDEIFYITVPKKIRPQNETQNSTSLPNNGYNDDCNKKNEGTSQEDDEVFHDAKLGDEWMENGLLEKISTKLKKNRGVVLTAVLAFSLGVVVSHCYQSNARVERSQ